MICLSKADESYYQRLTWNQAPSPLAATHTTRQDLNGISNLREHVDAAQDDGSGGTAGSLLNGHDDSNQAGSHPAEPFDGAIKDAGRQSRISGMSKNLMIPPLSNPHISTNNPRTVLVS